ncbi:hypothetical protein, partial [Mesorhizobium sp. L2C067A000]|uniref:hypothetical protein n=2 Tax=unclassified Mesorhizobium TaxID=325217 RepID=UPI0005183078
KISMPCDIAGANHHESANFSPCQSYLSAYAKVGEMSGRTEGGAVERQPQPTGKRNFDQAPMISEC